MSDEQLQARAPYAISEPRLSVSTKAVRSAFGPPGYRVRRSLDVVQGAGIYGS